MMEKPIVEIFKTKLDWGLGPYHWRETDPIYVAKVSDNSNRYVTDDISTMPKNLLTFCNTLTKIRLPKSTERTKFNFPGDTDLNVVNEALSHDEISDLLTAFAHEAYSYPPGYPGDRKVATVEIFNAKAIYYLDLDQTKETPPCYMLNEVGGDTFRPFDKLSSLPNAIVYNFAPGSRIRIPEYRRSAVNSDIDRYTRLGVVHEPLTDDEISELLGGFVFDLLYRQQEQKESNKGES